MKTNDWGRMQQRIEKTYEQAQRGVKRKLADHTKRFRAEDRAMRLKLKNGEITKEEYERWQRTKVWQGERWQEQLDSITAILTEANRESLDMIMGRRIGVFADGASYQDYVADQLGVLGTFTVYDEATVTRLIAEHPSILPKKKIDPAKDKAWNMRQVNNCIVQGIIQGESIETIADRITNVTGSTNRAQMVRTARTAMTGAQNAGRVEAMHNQQQMGIRVQKMWIATLDNKTRDAHADLDGQIVDVDKPFTVSVNGQTMEIMYPGDPSADPSLVYNCRCTLGYVYPDSPMVMPERRDQMTGETIANMSYSEWRDSKEIGRFDEYEQAKRELYQAIATALRVDRQEKFSGLWAIDVSIEADYEALKGRIPAKEAYFRTKIQEYHDSGDSAKEAEMQRHLDDLLRFKAGGESSEAVKAAENRVKEIARDFPKKQGKDPFSPDAYSQARKDAAMWARSPTDACDRLWERSGEVWKKASREERDAAYEYTQSYHKFNEPLRGIEYGTNRFLGVGNTDLNASYANNGARLNALTDIIDQSTYDFDVWLQRGIGYGGADKFLRVDSSLLEYGSEAELQAALLGTEPTEFGFMSCGSSKGTGFDTNPIIMNIYAPAGTKMLYVEPFSAYGGSGFGQRWNGEKKPTRVGSENETLLQQGTRMRITKVERKGRTIYLDLEIVAQDSPQRWQP